MTLSGLIPLPSETHVAASRRHNRVAGVDVAVSKRGNLNREI
jgi:hypothetical protein